MRRRSSLAVLPVAAASLALGYMTNDEIRQQLAKIRETQTGMMNVAPAEGDYIYDLVKKMGAQRVLEIGTSNGYSGSWFAMGLRETGGKLITLELDEGRWRLAQRNFKKMGLEPHIDSRLVNALEELPKLEGPFDIVFIDAWKPDYIKYYEAVLPKVREGGIILAHNVKSHPDEMQDFLERIQKDPAVKTEFLTVGPAGLSVSTKL